MVQLVRVGQLSAKCNGCGFTCSRHGIECRVSRSCGYCSRCLLLMDCKPHQPLSFNIPNKSLGKKGQCKRVFTQGGQHFCSYSKHIEYSLAIT